MFKTTPFYSQWLEKFWSIFTSGRNIAPFTTCYQTQIETLRTSKRIRAVKNPVIPLFSVKGGRKQGARRSRSGRQRREQSPWKMEGITASRIGARKMWRLGLLKKDVSHYNLQNYSSQLIYVQASKKWVCDKEKKNVWYPQSFAANLTGKVYVRRGSK